MFFYCSQTIPNNVYFSKYATTTKTFDLTYHLDNVQRINITRQSVNTSSLNKLARWCDGGRMQRSHVGSLTDTVVKSSKRHAAEASLDKVVIGSDPPLENVPHFQYLGSRLQCEGSDEADVRHRLEIAQSAFSSLSHMWAIHRLSRTTKLRLYRVCVCSSLTHYCEAWTLNQMVIRSKNGFDSKCLHVMTDEHYRETATAPAYDLVLAVHRRCLRYLGPVLRMPADRMV